MFFMLCYYNKVNGIGRRNLSCGNLSDEYKFYLTLMNNTYQFYTLQ
jgi:hypothetical protein